MSVPTITRLLVVGIGDHASQYSRRSVGHLMLDSLSARLQAPLKEIKSPTSGHFARKEVMIGDTPVDLMLYKPKLTWTFVGKNVRRMCVEHLASLTSLCVIAEDLYHDNGVVTHTFGGPPLGIRGIRSINSSLRDFNYHRIRIGVGRKGKKDLHLEGQLDRLDRMRLSPEGDVVDAVLDTLAEVLVKNQKLPLRKQ